MKRKKKVWQAIWREMGRCWKRQADTVITIIDVICLSFISANGCCILFVLLDVEIKYANCETKWMFPKWTAVRRCRLLYLVRASKHPPPPIRSREVNGKQREIRTQQQKGFQSNHRLIDWLINWFLPSSVYKRRPPKWGDKKDKIYHLVEISQAFLTTSWVMTE